MTHRSLMGATALAVGLLTDVQLALAAPRGGSEDLPLNLPEPTTEATVPGSGGNGLLRTIIGLAVVVAVIYGLAWVLRKVKEGREAGVSGTGLSSVATLPLGPNRAVHVVRVGRDVLLLGSAEHQISQLARYSEEEAEQAGLLAPAGSVAPAAASAAPAGRGPLMDRLRSWTVRR